MKSKVIILSAAFAVLCVLFFSGQQRTYRRPAQPPAQPEKRELPIPRETKEPDVPLLFMAPEDFRFPPQPQGDRSTAPQTITLVGNPREKGLYVTRTKIPKGKQVIPHTHTDSRTVVVISGTYYYGVGEVFDAKKLVAMPPGSFYTEPAGVPHFTWAVDDDVVVQTTAIGPSGTQIVPEKKEEEKPGRVDN
ncbi:MAG: cupin domain-containing protein [Planctomycetaceae bacterium]|jgi:quercetin dioxygenase-like cupin family protein|nr:cupin domain-containing protein [Planctomycetaceae bacterium]